MIQLFDLLWWSCASVAGLATAYATTCLLAPRGDVAAGLLALALAITALLAGQPLG
jgi:hypothetical protein